MTATLRALVAWISRGLGLDFHIAMTLLLRSWAAGAGLVTVLALTWALIPVEQGYYFTFGTLIAMQVFFELGLNQVITQVVSHEAAHLRVLDDGAIKGDPRGADRIAALMESLRKWYQYAAIAFFLVVGTFGYWFVSARGELSTWQWLPAWLLLVAATCANLRISPFLAVYEGLGQVGQVARLRLIQSVLGYLSLWALLIFGGALLAVAVVPIVAAICSSIWLRRRAPIVLSPSPVSHISWRREILPFQWRVGVSWVSGFFIFHLFTPVVFARHGAVAAGQVGLALTIFTAISTIGLSWVNAKAPELARLVARGESAGLNRLFLRVASRSTLFVLIACSVLVSTVAWASQAGIEVADRVAAPLTLMFMGGATLGNALIYACAAYMRAHRREPLLPQSVVSAVAIGLSVLLLRDVTSMFAAYVGIVMLIALPWTLWLIHENYSAHRSSVRLGH